MSVNAGCNSCICKTVLHLCIKLFFLYFYVLLDNNGKNEPFGTVSSFFHSTARSFSSSAGRPLSWAALGSSLSVQRLTCQISKHLVKVVFTLAEAGGNDLYMGTWTHCEGIRLFSLLCKEIEEIKAPHLDAKLIPFSEYSL